MTKEQLEGRFNYKKEEFLQILKSEGKFIEFTPEEGYIYELVKPIYHCLTKIRLSLKNGRIFVHETEHLR